MLPQQRYWIFHNRTLLWIYLNRRIVFQGHTQVHSMNSNEQKTNRQSLMPHLSNHRLKQVKFWLRMRFDWTLIQGILHSYALQWFIRKNFISFQWKSQCDSWMNFDDQIQQNLIFLMMFHFQVQVLFQKHRQLLFQVKKVGYRFFLLVTYQCLLQRS